MSVAIPDGVSLSVSIVQVIDGGEPDDSGLCFAGMRSPLSGGFGPHCACAAAALPYDLWESIERHDLYSRGTSIWVRTITPDDTTPLPEGAVVLETHTVIVGTI
ncbi:hypothetical protein CLV63_12533 [Murinocardiopsis flavida]|uniref:Uncharacterized protein n=1 Tax=Murinocardiopsis flavida TaxID=645275 RepID=A0A2P8CXG1_9ACTN|nr:hypothetical protein [Murinocardiopsis flavida]PSK89639.1 hypothetical protein CLV63_12533 [Murinocardiopsis flavida]